MDFFKRKSLALVGMLLFSASPSAQDSNIGCKVDDPDRLSQLNYVDRQALYDLYENLQGKKAVTLGDYVLRPDLLEGTLFAQDALQRCDLPSRLIISIPFTPISTPSGVATTAGKILHALLTKPSNPESMCVVAAKARYAGCLSSEMAGH